MPVTVTLIYYIIVIILIIVVVLSQISKIQHTHIKNDVSKRSLSLQYRTYIGMNDPPFLFVMNVMFLNPLDEGRKPYHYEKYVYSHDISGFTQYLHFMQNSESGLFKTGYSTADALQNILVFLTDSPNEQIQENVKTLRI